MYYVYDYECTGEIAMSAKILSHFYLRMHYVQYFLHMVYKKNTLARISLALIKLLIL